MSIGSAHNVNVVVIELINIVAQCNKLLLDRSKIINEDFQVNIDIIYDRLKKKMEQFF